MIFGKQGIAWIAISVFPFLSLVYFFPNWLTRPIYFEAEGRLCEVSLLYNYGNKGIKEINFPEEVELVVREERGGRGEDTTLDRISRTLHVLNNLASLSLKDYDIVALEWPSVPGQKCKGQNVWDRTDSLKPRVSVESLN